MIVKEFDIQLPFGLEHVGIDENGVMHTIPRVATPAPGAPLPPPPFVPNFQSNVYVIGYNGQSVPLNETYFATPQTAEWVRNKFGASAVFEKEYGGVGGVYSATAKELWLRWTGTPTVELNAGMLADYYRRNPEDKFPGLAEKYVRALIDSALASAAIKDK